MQTRTNNQLDPPPMLDRPVGHSAANANNLKLAVERAEKNEDSTPRQRHKQMEPRAYLVDYVSGTNRELRHACATMGSSREYWLYAKLRRVVESVSCATLRIRSLHLRAFCWLKPKRLSWRFRPNFRKNAHSKLMWLPSARKRCNWQSASIGRL